MARVARKTRTNIGGLRCRFDRESFQQEKKIRAMAPDLCRRQYDVAGRCPIQIDDERRRLEYRGWKTYG
jgi:hypothetical protein